MRTITLAAVAALMLSLTGCGRSAEEKDYLEQISQEYQQMRETYSDEELVDGGRKACVELRDGAWAQAGMTPQSITGTDFDTRESIVVSKAAETFLCG